MAKFYDISKKITNELPTVKITEEIICTVNNRKNNVLNVLAMIQEAEKKENEDEENARIEMIQKALKLLVGEKTATAIEKLDLPLPEYNCVFTTIMTAAQGGELDEQSTP